MNRNNLWKFIFVIVVLVWAFLEVYPPLDKNLAEAFKDKAVRKDAAFNDIAARLDKLQAANPQRAFANVLEAVGTNQITNYFPFYEVKGELNPTRSVVDQLQRDSAGRIKRGIDIQGGTSFLVGMQYGKTGDTNDVTTSTNGAASDELRSGMLSQAVEVLRKRVDKFGVAEPVIQPEGDDRILIQLPGLSEAVKDEARENIQKVAYLEMRMVNPDSEKLITEGLSAPGYERMRLQETDSTTGQTTVREMLVKKKPELTGKYIRGATVFRDNVGQPEIQFTLDSEGGDMFGKTTRENIGQRLAIVLDGELKSAPVIQGAIEGGVGTITGRFTDKEAFDLANVLQNPLQVPVKILSESSVDPTLGRDTVNSGIRAAIIGTIAVAGFMAVYYMFAGLVADLALITNIIILLGVMCSVGTTLTLPGIAGVVLTIGMAVDANVLIFERIREETAKGKSLRGALAAGYERAFGTIFDSHVTTLISSVILIFMGTGPIKGFGVTLTIGVAASLFTALVVTRLIFDFTIDRGWLKSLPMLHVIRATKLDFMKVATPAFICTWLLIIAGLGFGGYRLFVKHDLLGTDFAGGDNLTLKFVQKVDANDVRKAVSADASVKEATIQYQRDINSGTELLTIRSPYNSAENVEKALAKDFPNAHFERVGSYKVGPIIGAEIQKTAVVASFVSLLGILVYVAVRYEFSFAVGAVIAVAHDVLMTIGCYCLTGLGGEGRQFNATMVAAVLTIIGFSINDTIVIFDRIREDLKMGVRGSFKDIINQALNQTLSRTIITSGTVFLATLSLYIFGGGAINDFAFTFLVGIITGTYSSIYIASYLVLKWHKGARPKASAQVTMETAAASRS